MSVFQENSAEGPVIRRAPLSESSHFALVTGAFALEDADALGVVAAAELDGALAEVVCAPPVAALEEPLPVPAPL